MNRIELNANGRWEVPDGLDVSNFDFGWRPDPLERPYIHQFGTQWQRTDGPRYIVDNNEGIKYHNFQHAIRLKNHSNFVSLIDDMSFDYSWHPDANDPPYVYVFGNQWYNAEIMPTVEYRMPGATDRKYINDIKATLLPNKTHWSTLVDNIDFDYSWVPNPYDPPYIYVFGNQWYDSRSMPTVMYVCPNATNYKYVTDVIAKLTPDPDKIDNFVNMIDREVEFDYSWVPPPNEPEPYTYAFGNQWYDASEMPTVLYDMAGSNTFKFIDNIKVTIKENCSLWDIPTDIDDSNFDYSWLPKTTMPMIYQYGTQWQKTGGPRLVVNDGKQITYKSFKVKKLANSNKREWRTLVSNIDFDYSWHPDDTDPPYIYVFGNQWYDAEIMPTVLYRVKGATEKKYIKDIKATLLPVTDNYTSLVDNEFDFDYSWRPDPNDPPYNYIFGNQWYDSITMPTLMYSVPNATQTKYIDTIKCTLKPNKDKWFTPFEIEEDFDYSWVPNPNDGNYVYVFGTQWQKTGGPMYICPNTNELKYIDTIKATKKYQNTRNFRPLVNNIEFDYSWHPDEAEQPYNYVFGNQWYDAEIMPTMVYKVKGATETKYIHDVKAILLDDKTNWIIPDDIEDFDYSWRPNPHEPPFIYQFGTQWQRTGGPKYIVEGATEIKYIDTIKAKKKANMRNWRIIEPVQEGSFDYSWHPDETDGDYSYVFGNNLHPAELMPTIVYKGKKGNKFSNALTPKLDIQLLQYEDSIYDALNDTKIQSAYVHLTKSMITPIDIPVLDKLTIHLIGQDEAIVPRDSIRYLYDKLTDYDYVKHWDKIDTRQPLDIIFLSNGEECAHENYQHLKNITKNLPNRVKIISNINGREASQHAAAKASKTPWYFLVNAKLKVNEDFDFSWQPDIFKSSRHYIFRATNILNDLEYGHMAIVANNKKLTLNTVVRGLDFTMDSPTEVVNMNSGVAIFNKNEWDTWRTSFRECIKLCYAKDSESKKRLEIWSTIAVGDFAQYSLQGAHDAIEYYKETNGKLEYLLYSYDWEWLHERFKSINKI